MALGVDSASNRNEYLEYFLGAKEAGFKTDNLTTFLDHCHVIIFFFFFFQLYNSL